MGKQRPWKSGVIPELHITLELCNSSTIRTLIAELVNPGRGGLRTRQAHGEIQPGQNTLPSSPVYSRLFSSGLSLVNKLGFSVPFMSLLPLRVERVICIPFISPFVSFALQREPALVIILGQ